MGQLHLQTNRHSSGETGLRNLRRLECQSQLLPNGAMKTPSKQAFIACLLLSLPQMTLSAPVKLLPGSAFKMIVFPDIQTATGFVKPYGEPPVNTNRSPPNQATCTSTPVSWTSVHATCTATAPAAGHSQRVLLVADSPNIGEGTYICDNGTYKPLPNQQGCNVGPFF